MEDIKEVKSSKAKILRDIKFIRRQSKKYRSAAIHNKFMEDIENKYKPMKVMYVDLFEDFK